MEGKFNSVAKVIAAEHNRHTEKGRTRGPALELHEEVVIF